MLMVDVPFGYSSKFKPLQALRRGSLLSQWRNLADTFETLQLSKDYHMERYDRTRDGGAISQTLQRLELQHRKYYGDIVAVMYELDFTIAIV